MKKWASSQIKRLSKYFCKTNFNVKQISFRNFFAQKLIFRRAFIFKKKKKKKKMRLKHEDLWEFSSDFWDPLEDLCFFFFVCFFVSFFT